MYFNLTVSLMFVKCKLSKKRIRNTGGSASTTGLRMGYHSEKGSTDNQGGDHGIRMDYHSKKANPSKHSKRLHRK
jgi:hypothetical protein